jgi:hypothetical protein
LPFSSIFSCAKGTITSGLFSGRMCRNTQDCPSFVKKFTVLLTSGWNADTLILSYCAGCGRAAIYRTSSSVCPAFRGNRIV